MHTIKITPNLLFEFVCVCVCVLLFEYQCISGKFIRLPNRIETFFCLNWNALVLTWQANEISHPHRHTTQNIVLCQQRNIQQPRKGQNASPVAPSYPPESSHLVKSVLMELKNASSCPMTKFC